MIPPRGFLAERYPLRHRLVFSAAIGINNDTQNSVFFPIVMSSDDVDVATNTIQVNPHNTSYEEDTGPHVRQMSIIDRMRISLKFNMTEDCLDLQETASGVFSGDSLQAIHLLWRPVFGSFAEKLNATDDDTGVAVSAMLGLTVDATNEDVVPLTTTKLSVVGVSDLSMPVSNVNGAQVFGDFNMTTNTTMEEHVWDEDLFQAMLRRSTVKGALRSFVGRTRHFTLTRSNPYRNFYVDKFVPRAIRRVVPFSFFGIQVHCPFITDVEQAYQVLTPAHSNHVGVKCIANFHEWNPEHDQDMGSQV